MIALNLHKTLKAYPTPWDASAELELPPTSEFGGVQETPAQTHPISSGSIYLHGLYLFDPQSVTSRDVRQFWWAGLKLLQGEVKKLGLSDGDVRKVMLDSFDTFHDAANGLWGALHQMTAKGGSLPFAAVEAHCQVREIGVVGVGGGRTPVPVSRGISKLYSPAVSCGNADEEAAPETDPHTPLLGSAEANKNSDAEPYPVAEFPEPTGYGWTPEGYEVRAALKRYSESTHADR